jgi:hypothetical protein
LGGCVVAGVPYMPDYYEEEVALEALKAKVPSLEWELPLPSEEQAIWRHVASSSFRYLYSTNR